MSACLDGSQFEKESRPKLKEPSYAQYGSSTGFTVVALVPYFMAAR